MAGVPLNDNLPLNTYVATEGQTVFPYGFWVEEAEDIDVYLNESTTPETLNDDYTVDEVQNDNGANVIFGSGLAAGTKVTITRSTTMDQLTGYTVGGDFNSVDLNTKFARIIAMLQEIGKNFARTLRLTSSSQYSGELFLPAPTARRAILWNADANGFVNSTYDPDTLQAAAADSASAAAASELAAEAARDEAEEAQAAAEAAAAEAASYVPLITPFGNTSIKVLKATLDGHYGFTNAILETDTPGKWVIVYRYGQGHEVTEGTQIFAADTYDNGQTLVNERVIYRHASYDTRNFVAAKMNGRLGILASRRNEAGTYTDAIFIYSDDDGVTWSSAAVTSPSAGYAVNFHGGMLPYPAAVGGHDTDGFIAYSYGAGSDIDAFKTTDNGATWTIVEDVVSDGNGFTLSEMAVARVGTQNKWVMVMRTGQTNAAVAVSSNMTTWTGPLDSGLAFNGNPPALIYYGQQLWFIGFSRKGREIVSGLSSHIVYAKANAQALYAANGSFSALSVEWQELTPVPDWASGYLFPFEINNKWYAGFVCGEQDTGGSSGPKVSMLCMIGDFLNVSTSMFDILKNVPRKNYLVNGGFIAWSATTSASLTTGTRTEAANGWFGTGNTGDTTVLSRQSFTPGQKEVPGNPMFYLKFASSSMGGSSSHSVDQRFGRVSTLGGQRCTLSFWAQMPTGTKTNIARIRITQNFGTGGSPSTAVTTSIATDLAIGTTWQYYEVPFNMPSIEGKTLGSNGDDYIQLLFHPIFSESSSYDLQLANVKLEPGPFASPFERETEAEVVGRLASTELIPTAGGTVLTIASGAITVTKRTPFAIHNVDTEASAATDDLDTINGGYSGQMILFRSPSSSRDTTFKDGTGNLRLAGDFTLSNVQDTITLVKDGSDWLEVSRSDNA